MSTSTTTNELGGCNYVRYEDLEPINLPLSACDQHVDGLKERLENQAEWKEQFDALTEIQRIAKYQPAYLGISLRQQSTVPLDVWFGPILACVNSLRSSLTMHALVTLSVLTFTEESRAQLASILLPASRHTPSSSPAGGTEDSPPPAVKVAAGRVPVKITSRMMSIVGTLVAQASSPAKSKFIQQKAEEVACQVAEIPNMLDPLLPTALKLAKENSRNSRYLFRMAGVVTSAWEAEMKRHLPSSSSHDAELTANPDFTTMLESLAHIGAMAIGDKLVDTRNRGKALLKKLQEFADGYDGDLSKRQQTSEIQQKIPRSAASMAELVRRVLETLSSSMDPAARAAFQKSLSHCESHSCSSIRGQRSRVSPSMRLRAPLGRSRIVSDFGPPSGVEASCKMTDIGTSQISKSTSYVPTGSRPRADPSDFCRNGPEETERSNTFLSLPTRGRDRAATSEGVAAAIQSAAECRERSPSVECLGSLSGPNGPAQCCPPPSESLWSAESCNKLTDTDAVPTSHRLPPRVPNPPSVPLTHSRPYANPHSQTSSAAGTATSHARVPSVRLPRVSGRAPSVTRRTAAPPHYQSSRPRSSRSSTDGFGDTGTALDSGGARSRHFAEGGGDCSSRRKVSVSGASGSFPRAPSHQRFPLGQPKPVQRLQSRDQSIPPAATDPAPMGKSSSSRWSMVCGTRGPPASAQLMDNATENSLPPLYNEDGDFFPEAGGAIVRKRSVTLTGNVRRVASSLPVEETMLGGQVERTSLGGIKGVIPKAPVKLGSGLGSTEEEVPMRRRISVESGGTAASKRTLVEGSRRKVSMDRPPPLYRKQSFVDRPPRCPGVGGNGKQSSGAMVPPLDIPPQENRRGRAITGGGGGTNPLEHSLGTLSTATGGSFRGHFRSRSLTGNRGSVVGTTADEGTMRAFASKFGFVDSTTSEGE